MARRQEEREEFGDVYGYGATTSEDVVFYPSIRASSALARFYRMRGVNLHVDVPTRPHDHDYGDPTPAATYYTDKKGFHPAKIELTRVLRGYNPRHLYGSRIVSQTDAVFITCECDNVASTLLFLEDEVEEVDRRYIECGLPPTSETRCRRCGETYTHPREGYILEVAARGPVQRDQRVSIYL